MRTAFLYIRVSTDEQADTGYSQRHQHEMLQRYCEVNGIQVKEAYFEDHSAKNFQRPEFTRMLLQLRKHRGLVDLVLFTKWDRFSRNAGDAYAMIATLNKLGVEPQAVEQPLNLEIPENKMMLAFYLAAPEVENDRRALNVFHGMRRAQKEGRVMGTAPVGYKNRLSETGRKYIAPDPLKAPIMQWVFQQLAYGQYSAESIWKEAVQRGLDCTKNTFWNAIRHPVYCGKVRIKAYKNEEEQLVQGHHEPLITEALFYRVQDVLNGKRKEQRTKITVDDRFPLRGFVLCPECGRVLTASSSRGRNGYYHYYHCISACGVRFKADQVNQAMVAELGRWKPHEAVQALYSLLLEDVYTQESKSKRTQLHNLQEEMTRVADRQKKARELLLSEALEADDYKAIKRECEQYMSRLEAKVAELSQDSVSVEPLVDKALVLLSNLDSVYVSADTKHKRDIIGSIYPEKLTFTEYGYRTARVNEAVQLIYNVGAAFSEIKMGQVEDLSSLSHQVIPLVHFSNHFLHDLRKLANLHSILFKAA